MFQMKNFIHLFLLFRARFSSIQMSLINPSLEVVYCSITVIIFASDYSLIRVIRFVSPFTDSSRNVFFISSRFKSLCRCRNFFLEF